eukprot:CAMPEP_0176031750 /NCGR_PEP_ID=MMETSP0120_2-20121206/15658_1 /TAXON_ID=160619 /ORGANISM="Kryptoperidinium foliaceum, Strain CCMP 1326" /LENGTH=181 /DNA_ID=CAMNT_0017365049 /DNA_START=8 /DNA_END=554 /DNA_ORIENTATION=+
MRRRRLSIASARQRQPMDILDEGIEEEENIHRNAHIVEHQLLHLLQNLLTLVPRALVTGQQALGPGRLAEAALEAVIHPALDVQSEHDMSRSQSRVHRAEVQQPGAAARPHRGVRQGQQRVSQRGHIHEEREQHKPSEGPLHDIKPLRPRARASKATTTPLQAWASSREQASSIVDSARHA